MSQKDSVQQRKPLNEAAFDYQARFFGKFIDEFGDIAREAARILGRSLTPKDTAALIVCLCRKPPQIPLEPPQIRTNPGDALYALRPDRTAPKPTMPCGMMGCSRLIILTTRNLVVKGKIIRGREGNPVEIGDFPAFNPIPNEHGVFEKFAIDGEPFPLCPACISGWRDEITKWNNNHSTRHKLQLFTYREAKRMVTEIRVERDHNADRRQSIADFLGTNQPKGTPAPDQSALSNAIPTSDSDEPVDPQKVKRREKWNRKKKGKHWHGDQE